MIAEVKPESYDAKGRKVFRPDTRRRSGFRPTFPIGRFLSEPLKYWCSDLEGLRGFLSTCKYISDEKQFARKDYWQPPEEFEETRQGDCDDFALWCWRQLLHLNYSARLVIGMAGRYGEGHAWVTFEKDGRTFLVEPLRWMIGLKMPRISTLRYHPKYSMTWDNDTVSYYSHEDRKLNASFGTIAPLVAEWVFLWGRFWINLLTGGLGLRSLRAAAPRRRTAERGTLHDKHRQGN